MKKTSRVSILCAAALLLAAFAGNALATDTPSSAVTLLRIWNDSFASILTVDNSYPSLIMIDDTCAGPLGWANLHAWRFSTNGATAQEFSNTDGFRFSADVTLTGTGDGESGLQVAPWWSQSDGRFNVRTPDGEVACFGGRLPFYSFTASHGVSYVKGTTVRLTIIYTPNQDMDEEHPATIEYIYDDGAMYSSGPLPFDMGNPAEDPPHGLWGILSPAYAGGHFQFNNMAGAGDGANFHVEWENITFQDLGTVIGTENATWGSVKTLYR
jgi:hypothetical protein